MTRYELVERIGSGGMAEIFRGKAIAGGGFEKPVAIKRILPHLSQDKRFVELLIAEANILSFLRHRNIVQIFDVGLADNQQYFLVMEYVDGVDLGALQAGLEHADARLSIDLGLYIGAEICEALEHAHVANDPDGNPMRLVHRDVSPSNVLLSRSGEVKLTDFGIAKRTEDVTGHGGVRGKFAYISPEQASNRRVDARSDVFSVGILLYEMLMARPLFSAMSDFEALLCVREGRVARPRDVDPSFPQPLDRILRKAMAADPDARYPGAGALGKELRDVRYSMPATGGDPAKELAEMIKRYVIDAPPPARPSAASERSVVRLHSAPGFTLHGDEDHDRNKSYADARQLLDSFEESVTRAVIPRTDFDSQDRTLDASEIAAIHPRGNGSGDAENVNSAFDLSEAQTMIMERNLAPQLRSSLSRAGGYGRAGSASELDDDVTTLDPGSQFPGSRMNVRPPGSGYGGPPGFSASPGGMPASPARGPQNGAPAMSGVPAFVTPPGPGAPGPPPGFYPGAVAPPHLPNPYGATATSDDPPRPSRRGWWIVSLGVIVAGVGSFFIAGAVLGEDKDKPKPKPAATRMVDAAAPEASLDAGVDAQSPGDAAVPDAKVDDSARTDVDRDDRKKKSERPKRDKKRRGKRGNKRGKKRRGSRR